MWREGRPISGRGDYILGTRDEFSMVGLQEPITPTDHRMVLGLLCGDRVTSNRAYVRGRTTWPVREEKGRTRQIEGDLHFKDLKRKIKKPSRKDRSTLSPWIPETTWKIADQRTALLSKTRTNQEEHRVLTRRFQEALKEDRRSRARRAGGGIKAVVSNNQVIEAWSKTQRWYQESKVHQVPPNNNLEN